MHLSDVNKNIVDLRFSEFDESELKDLQSKKKELEKKISTAKTKKPEYEKQLGALEKEITDTEQEVESEKRAGRAKFSKKATIDYRGKNRRPPYHFTWVRYTPTNDYREFNQWLTGYNYSPVKYGKDPFYPIGAKVNGANLWQFQDVVFVKRDLKDYLLEKVAEQKRQTGGEKLLEMLEKQWEREDQYLAQKKFQSFEDMEQQLRDNGISVDDDVLRSIGL